MEEQFYLIVPFFMLWLRRGFQSHFQAAALVLLVALSFCLSWLSRGDRSQQRLAFYSMPSRFWQLLSGTALEHFEHLITSHTVLFRKCSAVPHLHASLNAVFLYLTWSAFSTPSASYSAFRAARATLAALAFIAAGAMPRPEWMRLANHWLSAKPLTYIGRVSYVLYLWHQPIFVVFRRTVGLDHAGTRAVAVLLALAAAVMTYHGVEAPFRRWKLGELRKPSRWATFKRSWWGATLLVLVPLLASLAWLQLLKGSLLGVLYLGGDGVYHRSPPYSLHPPFTPAPFPPTPASAPAPSIGTEAAGAHTSFWIVPLGVIALWKWCVLLFKLIAASFYQPTLLEPGDADTLRRRFPSALIVPTVGTDDSLGYCLHTWLQNAPDEIIFVVAGKQEEQEFATKKVNDAISACLKAIGPECPTRCKVVWSPVINKRHQLVQGVRAADPSIDVFIFLDDDVDWPETFLLWALKPFEERNCGVSAQPRVAQRALHAPNCLRVASPPPTFVPLTGPRHSSLPHRRSQAVTTTQRMRACGARPTTWEILADIRLVWRFVDVAATQVLDRGCQCASGRTAAFRACIVRDEQFLSGLPSEYWGEKLLVSGDDKFCTRWLTQHDWLIYAQLWRPECTIGTTFKTDASFLKQLLRWTRNTWRSDVRAVFLEAFMWRRHPFLSLIMVEKMTSPFTTLAGIALVTHGVLFSWIASVDAAVACYILVSRGLRLLPYVLLRRTPHRLMYLPQFVLFMYFVQLIKLYALFTLHITTWYTRAASTSTKGAGTAAAGPSPAANGTTSTATSSLGSTSDRTVSSSSLSIAPAPSPQPGASAPAALKAVQLSTRPEDRSLPSVVLLFLLALASLVACGILGRLTSEMMPGSTIAPTISEHRPVPASEAGPSPFSLAKRLPRPPNSFAALAAEASLIFGAAIDLRTIERIGDDAFATWMQRTVAQEFTAVTPMNALKWLRLRPSPFTFYFGEADKVVTDAISKGLQVTGHALAWINRKDAPTEWMEQLFVQNPTEVRHQLVEHIQTVVGRYCSVISDWDVINEPMRWTKSGVSLPFDDSWWLRAAGPDVISLSLRTAHAACPSARLWINLSPDCRDDVDCEAWMEAEFAHIEELLASGEPLHGVGFQMHQRLADSVYIDAHGGTEACGLLSYQGANRIMSKQFTARWLAKIAGLGLLLRVSEADVGIYPHSDEMLRKQAAAFAGSLEACLSVRACESFTVWGVSDRIVGEVNGNDGGGLEPLLWNSGEEPKPAVAALRAVLRHGRRPLNTTSAGDSELPDLHSVPSVAHDEPPLNQSLVRSSCFDAVGLLQKTLASAQRDLRRHRLLCGVCTSKRFYVPTYSWLPVKTHPKLNNPVMWTRMETYQHTMRRVLGVERVVGPLLLPRSMFPSPPPSTPADAEEQVHVTTMLAQLCAEPWSTEVLVFYSWPSSRGFDLTPGLVHLQAAADRRGSDRSSQPPWLLPFEWAASACSQTKLLLGLRLELVDPVEFDQEIEHAVAALPNSTTPMSGVMLRLTKVRPSQFEGAVSDRLAAFLQALASLQLSVRISAIEVDLCDSGGQPSATEADARRTLRQIYAQCAAAPTCLSVGLVDGLSKASSSGDTCHFLPHRTTRLSSGENAIL